MRLAMEGDNGLLQVYAEDSVFCQKNKERLGVRPAAKRKRKTKSTYYTITYWMTEAKTLCF